MGMGMLKAIPAHLYCLPEIMRRIGLTSAVMSSLRKVWNNRQLCVDTKVHVYRALVLSLLLYGSETWTLLASDIKELEAFHLRCQRQLLLCQLAGPHH